MHIIRLAIMLFKKFYYIFDIGSLRIQLWKIHRDSGYTLNLYTDTQNSITFKILGLTLFIFKSMFYVTFYYLVIF